MTDKEREALVARISARLELPMAILALIWVAVIVLQVTEALPPDLRFLVQDLDIAIWLIFLLQFLIEFAIAPHKGHYLRTHWVTAISVLIPFFRVLRIVVAAAALRSLFLANVILGAGRATRRIGSLLRRGGFQYVLGVVVIVTLLGAAGVYFLERTDPRSELGTYSEALWWAATMITTINTNSDPITPEGRVVGILLRIVGLSLFGYLTATIATFLLGQAPSAADVELSDRLTEETRELEALRRDVERLEARSEEILALLERERPPHR